MADDTTNRPILLKSMSTISKDTKPILIFNPQKKLISVWGSAFAMAKALNFNVSSIRNACSGKIISYKKLYFRYYDPYFTLELKDYGSLLLSEYDNYCGISRKLYPNSKMERKGMHYKKTPKEKSNYWPFKAPLKMKN